MSMPSRQLRAPLARGVPAAPAFDGPSIREITQRAWDITQAAVPYLPVVGPASEMVTDIRDGNYGGALFNGAMLAADLSPLGPARRVIRIVDAINDMRRAPLLARAATQTNRIRKIEKVGRGYEVHHTIPMEGWKTSRIGSWRGIPGASRDAEGLLRNHPAFLKVMDKVAHRRMTGKWTDPSTGKLLDQFDATQRAWHGTNALQKTTALAAAATVADWGENIVRDVRSGEPAQRR